MNNYEVPEPILNSPYEEPAAHWHIEEGKVPKSGLDAARRDTGIATPRRGTINASLPRYN